MDTSTIPLKQCSRKEKCIHPDRKGVGWLPKTTEYFYKHGKYLASKCRYCQRQYDVERNLSRREERKQWIRQYRLDHPETAKETAQRHREKHKDAIREAKRQYYLENKAAIADRDRRYREAHRDEIKVKQFKYREAHREEFRLKSRKYREEHPDKIRASLHRYYETHKNQLLMYSKRHREQHRDHYRAVRQAWVAKNRASLSIYHAKLRAHKRHLPSDFTLEDWRRALDFFNNSCAVCRRQLQDLFSRHTVARDHWIPITSPDCPGTVPKNILPLCHGEGGCNNSKGNLDPVEWLNKRFGKVKARQILKRIQTYFDSLD